jgi:hypothetical protein
MPAYPYTVRFLATAVGPDVTSPSLDIVGNPREIQIEITAPNSNVALDRFTAMLQKLVPPACPHCGSAELALGIKLLSQGLQVVVCPSCNLQFRIQLT